MGEIQTCVYMSFINIVCYENYRACQPQPGRVNIRLVKYNTKTLVICLIKLCLHCLLVQPTITITLNNVDSKMRCSRFTDR